MTLINLLYFLGGIIVTLVGLTIIGIVIAWKDFKKRQDFLKTYQEYENKIKGKS